MKRAEWERERKYFIKALRKAGKYNGEPCYLTAYQIANLAIDAGSATTLDAGGKYIGTPVSLAQQIARWLSQDIREWTQELECIYKGKLERSFYSMKGIRSISGDMQM